MRTPFRFRPVFRLKTLKHLRRIILAPKRAMILTGQPLLGCSEPVQQTVTISHFESVENGDRFGFSVRAGS